MAPDPVALVRLAQEQEQGLGLELVLAGQDYFVSCQACSPASFHPIFLGLVVPCSSQDSMRWW